jgi:hypothetical protein
MDAIDSVAALSINKMSGAASSVGYCKMTPVVVVTPTAITVKVMRPIVSNNFPIVDVKQNWSRPDN